jgi:Ca2+-transporting ATPase
LVSAGYQNNIPEASDIRTGPLIYILFIAAVATYLLNEYIHTGVILAVVILNSVLGYIQEFKAEESIRALKKLTVPKARVLREGVEKEIHSKGLVPGDIVLLSSGSKFPADLRLFRTVEFRVDESLLTVESHRNRHVCILEIVVWSLFVIWYLLFGI